MSLDLTGLTIVAKDFSGLRAPAPASLTQGLGIQNGTRLDVCCCCSWPPPCVEQDPK